MTLLAIIGHEGVRAYHRSFEEVTEQEPDLSNYRPFHNDARLATLDVPATLTLAENPPRLDGATALYPVYAAFVHVQATYPMGGDYNPHRSDVRCSKTGTAYDRLIRGETDIIFVAPVHRVDTLPAGPGTPRKTATPLSYPNLSFLVCVVTR